METLRGLKMESTFEGLVEAGIDRDQFWELEEKDFANMGHNMGTRLRFRKGKKERAEILKTMRCKIKYIITVMYLTQSNYHDMSNCILNLIYFYFNLSK